MDIEDTLITAIQNQEMVKIHFRKETDQDWVVREVAPYDVFNKEDKEGNIRRILLGYCWKHKDYNSAPIYIYLDTISNAELLGERFDGDEVRRLIRSLKSPNISRNW